MVSFRATAGQIYGLVGANGAGKTTLLKHLLGLLRATTGLVRVFGLDPVRDPVRVLSRVGYLSEERELPEWMRVDELMRYTQAYHPTWDGSYARELLETFGLDPAKKIKELSKGMRAQAGLLVAVAHRPELLILDEPSSGLDAVVRRDILDAIVRTVADDGRTVIFSSHLLDEVERMSDHVTMMHHGRVTLGGALDEVRSGYQRSRVRFVEHFDHPPSLEVALAMEGGGRMWSVVHTGSVEQFHHSVLALGGEVVESRDAPRSKRSSWRGASAGLSASAQLAGCDRERRRSADRLPAGRAGSVASIGVAVMVASLASFAALAARYPRRLNIGSSCKR